MLITDTPTVTLTAHYKGSCMLLTKVQYSYKAVIRTDSVLLTAIELRTIVDYVKRTDETNERFGRGRETGK